MSQARHLVPLSFLILYHRNIPAKVRDAQLDMITQDGQEIKVCVRTYRLFYVPNKEDYLWKFRSKAEMEVTAVNLKKRNKLRKRWLEQSKVMPPALFSKQKGREQDSEIVKEKTNHDGLSFSATSAAIVAGGEQRELGEITPELPHPVLQTASCAPDCVNSLQPVSFGTVLFMFSSCLACCVHKFSGTATVFFVTDGAVSETLFFLDKQC